MKHKFKKVEIHWVDSVSTRGWTHMEGFKGEDLTVVSIGFIVHETKTNITISTSYTHYGSCMDPLTIPRCAILSQRIFK